MNEVRDLLMKGFVCVKTETFTTKGERVFELA